MTFVVMCDKTSKKMLSIIIIEYHSLNDIKKCIESIKANCPDLEYEVIVSSNSCYSEKKQKEIKHETSGVKWLFNARNGGFAYGMNRGLGVASGDYLVIMNPDVKITASLLPMLAFLETHKEVGAIAPQIVGHDGEIQDSCREFVIPYRFAVRQLRRLFTKEVSIRSERIDYSKVQTVDFVIGAFIMIRREVYEKIGGLDEGYFMYAEDVDLCTRIWLAGYQVVYYPEVRVEYEGSRSARVSKKYAQIFIKSHLRYWKKFGFLSCCYPKNPKRVFSNV